MTIKILCPHCAQRISAPDDVVGTVVECPTCNRTFEAVAMDTPSQAPVAAVQPRRVRAPLPPQKRGGRTAIVVGCAIAVVAGGLYWWHAAGPGFPDGAAASGPEEKAEKAGKQTQGAPASAAPGTPPVAAGSDPKMFEGVWRGTVRRTVVSKPYDVTLTITFNEKGEGFPKFETPDGEATVFPGAGLATLFQSGGKNKVILLREWDVSLSPDKTTMTWSEVDGPAQVKFTKQ